MVDRPSGILSYQKLFDNQNGERGGAWTLFFPRPPQDHHRVTLFCFRGARSLSWLLGSLELETVPRELMAHFDKGSQGQATRAINGEQ